MANNDAPFGLRLVNSLGSAGFNARVKPYYVPAGDSTAIFIGDCVVRTSDGANTSRVVAIGGTFEAGQLPEVTRVTAGDGNPITGVVVGVMPVTQDSVIYRAASTERVLLVCDDPNAEFEIQADGDLTETMVGLNAVLIDTHAGSTVTGLSGTELDTGTDVPAADASNQLTIQRIGMGVDNDTGAANQVAVVKIINHTEAHGVIGI